MLAYICFTRIQIIFYNNFYWSKAMSFLFATEKEREIGQLKKRRMHNILLFNLSEIERKKKMKEEDHRQKEYFSMSANKDAVVTLQQQSKRIVRRRYEQRNLLKDSYEAQIREKEERAKMEKQRDKEFLYRQREHMEFEESRRMVQLERMFNRITYDGVPMQRQKRAITEPNESSSPYNPEPGLKYQGSNLYHNVTKEKPYANNGEKLSQRNVATPYYAHMDSLDNLKVESFNLPKPSQSKASH